ncbi:MAG: hypothetical protein DRP45_07150 [Candidatus Zixiibacteriota bacterium]|nr:MAG: hypothetical protein DRP45_07150 [candidate division Zixibacteria bacterium]
MPNDDLSNRLSRIRNHIVSETKPVFSKLPGRYQLFANELGGRLQMDRAGCFCELTELYPFGYPFGECRLEYPEHAASVRASCFASLDVEGEIPLEDLIFLDTETTGLGGAGAVAFLIGCGSITAQGFEIRQYLLPDYSDEAAMLEFLLSEFDEKKGIVSYNGAAFDLNLLRDRMIINRVGREIPCRFHFDLLHSARRFYKRRIRDCSLTNVEREIFGFHRTDDIPGYLIPSVYFEWLGSEDLSAMHAVVEHNRLDILAMYFLLLRVIEAFRTEGSSLEEADDIYSLSRVYGRRHRNDKVVEVLDRLGDKKNQTLSEDVLLYQSFARKRTGDWDGAVAIWHRLSESSSKEAYWADLELAKYFEHRSKKLEQAFHFADMARNICPYEGRQVALLEKRLGRLRSKLS